MKSELEQFNKLRTPPPFKTFYSIRFDLGETPPPISYSQASSISKQSMQYFRSVNISANKIRARYPIQNPVQLSGKGAKQYIELQQDIVNSTELRSSNKYPDLYKLVGGHLRRGEYKNIISLAQKNRDDFIQLGFLQVCAFISAIISKDDTNEFEFFQGLQNTFFSSPENINHLFDELHLLSCKENYPTPLLELVIGDVSLLHELLVFRPHVFPVWQLYFCLPRPPLVGMTQLINNISSKLPPLIPVGEGFLGLSWKDPTTVFPLNSSTAQSNQSGTSNSTQSTPSKQKKSGNSNSKNRSRTPIKSKESSDVLSFISQWQFDKAIQLATEALKKNPTDSEMYLHRAFSLYHLAKIEDAINDCTISLAIKKTDKALRMRASFWLLLGESTLCKEDLSAMEDKFLYQSIMKVNNQNKNNQIGPNMMPLNKAGKPKMDQKSKRHSELKKYLENHLS